MHRKRIILLLLVLLLLPGISGKAAAQQEDHYHGNIRYEPWSGNTLPRQDGYYYLTQDILRSETAFAVTIPAGVQVHLCLNSHTVTHCNTTDRLCTVKGDLTVEDCTGDTGGITYGGAVANSCSYGALLQVQRGGTLTMTGGQIYGLTATHATGAAVYVHGANTTARAVFQLLGGQLHSNTLAICMTPSVSQPAKENFSQVNILGGSLWGNGTAVTVKSDVLQIEGGVITENSAEGPAVCVAEDARLRLSGRPYISENPAGNLFLAGRTCMELGQLEPGAKVGVGAEQAGRILSSGQGQIPGDCFSSDDPDYKIVLREQQVYLGYDHEHPLAGPESVSWQKWADAKRLPTASGNYYLAQDVHLEEEALAQTDVVLNLCLNGHSITAVEGRRIMTVATGAQVHISDCRENCGSLTGGSSDLGGGFYIMQQGSLFLHNGIITGNTATEAGGGVYLAPGGCFQMFGGQILGCSARTGGGIYAGEGCQVLLAGGTITDNTATETGGGVSVGDLLQVQADPVVAGNGPDNVELRDNACIAAALLTQGARLFVSARNPNRPITDTAVDGAVAGCFFSDSPYRLVEHAGFVYLNVSREHTHCGCCGESDACDHSKVCWQAWEREDRLPEKAGYYYLLENVVLTRQANILPGENIYLCLNGHRVTAAAERRLIQVYAGGQLTVTDCVGGGKLTGGNQSNGGAVSVLGGARMTLFAGQITGNTGTLGSAVYLQEAKGDLAGGAFFMYGGQISENTGYNGTIYADSGSRLVIRGGSITGNWTENHAGAVYLAPHAYADMQNVTVQGNRAGKRGGGIYQSAGAELTLRGSRILDNTGGDTGAALYLGGEFVLESCRITGNTTANGTAVYVAPDTGGQRKMGGELWIWGNTGTMKADLYLGKGITVTATEAGFGPGTGIRVQIYQGFLTNVLLAAYDYTGGNRVYTVTYGTKSLTDPEKEAPEKQKNQPEQKPAPTQPESEEAPSQKPIPQHHTLPEDRPVGQRLRRCAYGLWIALAGGAFALGVLHRKKQKKGKESVTQ